MPRFEEQAPRSSGWAVHRTPGLTTSQVAEDVGGLQNILGFQFLLAGPRQHFGLDLADELGRLAAMLIRAVETFPSRGPP